MAKYLLAINAPANNAMAPIGEKFGAKGKKRLIAANAIKATIVINFLFIFIDLLLFKDCKVKHILYKQKQLFVEFINKL